MKNVKSMLFALCLLTSGAVISQTHVTGKGLYVYDLDKTIIADDISEVVDPAEEEVTVTLTNVLGEASGNIGAPGTMDHVIFGGYQGAYEDGTIVCKGGGLCAQVFGHQLFIYND